jgi:hypothetical protein
MSRDAGHRSTSIATPRRGRRTWESFLSHSSRTTGGVPQVAYTVECLILVLRSNSGQDSHRAARRAASDEGDRPASHDRIESRKEWFQGFPDQRPQRLSWIRKTRFTVTFAPRGDRVGNWLSRPHFNVMELAAAWEDGRLRLRAVVVGIRCPERRSGCESTLRCRPMTCWSRGWLRWSDR